MKTYSDPTGPGWTIEDQLANAVRELLAVVEYYEHRTKDPITGRKDDWPAKYQAREALKRREQAAAKRITVHVRGGVAYCDDPAVRIIDHDNR